MSHFNVITGASRGIGETITRHLVKERSENLVLLARDLSRLKSLQAELSPTKIYPIQVDLIQKEAIEQIELPKNLTKLKALVLNAGSFHLSSILESNTEVIYKQFELNLFSMVHLIQKFSPYFVDGFTQIFLTASVSSYKGSDNSGLYVASKHAVLGLARSLRMELAPRKIRVTSIAPGSTWSSSWEGSGADPNSTINPIDIAKTIQFVLETSIRTNFDEIILNPI